MPRLFEQGADVDPILTYRVAWGLAANSTKNSTWAKILAWFQTNLTFPPTPPTLQTIVNIGDWDMNASSTVSIAHVLDWTKIRTIKILIIADDDSGLYPSGTDLLVAGIGGSAAATGSYKIDATNVVLNRVGTGFYDAVDFDKTSYNRGFIVIESVP